MDFIVKELYIYILIIVEIDFNMIGKCNKKVCNRCVFLFLFRMNGKWIVVLRSCKAVKYEYY